MQRGSHDKPSREASGLLLISTPCLDPSNLSVPPDLLLAWFAFSMLVLLLFPFAFFFFWCETNIKALLRQLGGLQQNLIGLRDPPACLQSLV